MGLYDVAFYLFAFRSKSYIGEGASRGACWSVLIANIEASFMAVTEIKSQCWY